LLANISFNEGVPEGFGNAHVERYLVIPDDLLNDVYSKQVCEFFMTGSHHRNSVILNTQNLFHQGTIYRDISLNSHYVAALKKSGKEAVYVSG